MLYMFKSQFMDYLSTWRQTTRRQVIMAQKLKNSMLKIFFQIHTFLQTIVCSNIQFVTEHQQGHIILDLLLFLKVKLEKTPKNTLNLLSQRVTVDRQSISNLANHTQDTMVSIQGQGMQGTMITMSCQTTLTLLALQL